MKTMVIAEAGVNHNGDLGQAKKLIEVAAKSGADFVKFQTFNADRLVTKKVRKARYQMQNSQYSESQFEMLKSLELSETMHSELIEESRLQTFHIYGISVALARELFSQQECLICRKLKTHLNY